MSYSEKVCTFRRVFQRLMPFNGFCSIPTHYLPAQKALLLPELETCNAALSACQGSGWQQALATWHGPVEFCRLSTRKAMRTLPPFTGGNKCQVVFLNTFLLMFHRTHLRSCWKACCNMVPIQMRSASMQCLKHVVVRSSMPF